MHQLQLDLNDRPRVTFTYPNTPYTGKVGRLVEIRGLIAFVYFEGEGVLMCYLSSLDWRGKDEEPLARHADSTRQNEGLY